MSKGVMRVVDKRQAKAYVQSGGCKCVYCGSEQIMGESVDVDSYGASQVVTCQNCGGRWTDLYVLGGVVANGMEYAVR